MAEKESIEILADRVGKIACANCKHHLDISALPLFTLFNCPECHAQQMVPGKLGSFLLLEELGRGGMGVVYRGQDLALGRPVAIKVMHKSLGDDQQFLETFQREARAAAAVNHKNVVQIFSFGREKGQPYLVMELVDGGRLDAYIAASQPLTEKQALEVCRDVAEGLKAAHAAGLMHGDIKPANILFDQHGVAKVADFGLAGFIRQQQAGARDIWGTPFYIAPEKARRQKVDQRADIYSLGATLFHAMAGRPPFDGDTPTHVVLARLQLPPPDISTIRTDLHPETIRIINRMLVADPIVRYPNYASLISDVQAALARLAEAPAVAAPKEDPPGRGKLWLYLAAGAGALLLIIVALVWLTSKRKPVEPPPAPTPTVAIQPAPVVTPPVVPAATSTKLVADPVNPFNVEEDRLITEALKPLALGHATKVFDRLELLCLTTCTNTVQHYWLQLFQAITLQFDGNRAEFDKLLRAFPPPSPASEVKDEATRIPLVAAQFLLGKVDREELAKLHAQAPAWCKTFVDFIEGWRIWTTGRARGEAHEKFKAYQSATPGEPGWPFAFRPLTTGWLKQVEKFGAIRPQLATLTKDRKFDEARKLLKDFAAQCTPAQYNVTESFLRSLARREKAPGGDAATDELADDMTDGSAAPKPVPPPKPAAQPASTAQPKPAATPPKPAAPAPKPAPPPQPARPPPALKAAFASSETKTEPARLAIDGNLQTRWASQLKDNQWLIVDLGSPRKVTGVVLHWDAAYAVDYKIQVSSDRALWTDALRVADSPGGRDVRTVKPTMGRYVRIYCLIRNYKLPNVALFEVQVLVDGQPPPPAP